MIAVAWKNRPVDMLLKRDHAWHMITTATRARWYFTLHS
ncbi:hypothetical protein C8J31_113102 [Rhizobium sp. PP-CC-2G-626]|nr:hypothetical protein C8J31_113102 [Rhizobium sp. PP-CC-2G-626]